MIKKEYYSGLDLLKFAIAAVIAFIYHYGIVYQAHPFRDFPGMNFLYTQAAWFVELFFMISGFVIYNSYYNRIREYKQTFSQFMIGRVIRIYPVMVLTVIVAAIGQWISIGAYGHPQILGYTDDRNTLTGVVTSILGIQSGWFSTHDSMSVNGPTWYISILMICYLIFFVILKGCKNNKNRENLCFLLMVLIGTYLYFKSWEIPLLYGSCARGYTNFFLGIFMAKLQKRYNSNSAKFKGILISICALVLFFYMYRTDNLGNIILMFSYVFSPSVLYLFLNLRGIGWISNNRVVSYLSKISLSVYLWNIPIAIWVHLIMEKYGLTFYFDGGKAFFIHMVISLVVAILTHEIYEKNITKYLKKKEIGINV